MTVYPAPKPEASPPKQRSYLTRKPLSPPTAQQVKAFREKQRAKAKPIKKRNTKRQASEFARCFHSRARVRWVKSLGCLVCECISPLLGQISEGKSDNAHTEKEGMGRRGHYSTIVPLCRTHHRWYDERRKFLAEPATRFAIASCAPLVEAAWQKLSAGGVHG